MLDLRIGILTLFVEAAHKSKHPWSRNETDGFHHVKNASALRTRKPQPKLVITGLRATCADGYSFEATPYVPGQRGKPCLPR